MTDPGRMQTIEQVWFSGAHSDVGGGYDAWGRKTLSDLPLRWMLDRAAAAGLALDLDVLKAYELSNDCCAELHDSHSVKWGMPLTRKIGTSPTEYIHRTVLDRWERKKPEYRPKAIAAKTIAPWLSVTPRPEFTKVVPS